MSSLKHVAHRVTMAAATLLHSHNDNNSQRSDLRFLGGAVFFTADGVLSLDDVPVAVKTRQSSRQHLVVTVT